MLTVMARLVIVAFTCLVALPAVAESPAARGFASTLAALRAIHQDESDVIGVPLAARIWLADAKYTMRDLAEEILNDGAGEAACVEERLHEELAAAAIALECEGAAYAWHVSVDVSAPKGHHDLIAVQLTLGIPYGLDSALFLFRREGARWRPLFERQVNDYESIGDALGDFQWKVSPPDEEGAFLVLTAAISPSPASVWQRLTYTVDRLVPWSDASRAIDHSQCAINIGYEDELEMHATPYGYGLRFLTGDLEPGFVRERILEYRVDGDEPIRVDPLAESVPEFVQEWLTLPEDEAMRWSDIAPIRFGDGFRTWGPIRQCVDGAWQARVDLEDFDTGEYESTYFIVTGENGEYRMRDIRAEVRPGCPDEN